MTENLEEKIDQILNQFESKKNIQNNVDSLLEQEKIKNEILNNMINYQENVDNILNNSSSSKQIADEIIMKEKRKQLDFVDKVKNQYTADEINYMNSELYNYYLDLNNQIDKVNNILLNQLLSQYQKNQLFYNDPLFKDLNAKVLIGGIGFPVPNKFLEDFSQDLKILLSENHYLSNYFISIKINPIEYSKVGEVYKKIDKYEFVINVQNREKIISKTK